MLWLGAGSFTKPVTARPVAIQIPEQVAVDGFATDGDPSLSCVSPVLQTKTGDRSRTYTKWQEDFAADSIDLFKLGYFKWAGRTITIHAMIVLLLQAGVDIPNAMPTFSKSLAVVKVVNIQCAYRVDQVFLNAKLSNKGDIRKAWSCIAWVGCLSELQTPIGETDVLIGR